MRPIQSEREPPSPCEVSALYDSGRFKVMVAMDSETYTVRALMRGEPERECHRPRLSVADFHRL